MTEIPIIEALALSVAVFEHNGNSYVKDNQWDAGVVNILKHSNKDIMRANLGYDHYSIGIANSPPLIKAKSNHFEKAQDIKNYCKKLLFKLLDNDDKNKADYETTLYKTINKETFTPSDIGFVASAPYYYQKSLMQDSLQLKLASEENSHVGIVGGKVAFDKFEIYRVITSAKYQGWVVQGFGDNKYLMFFANMDRYPRFEYKPGDVIGLQGKVKDHVLELDKYPMTKLTYVKIIGDKHEISNPSRTNISSDLF